MMNKRGDPRPAYYTKKLCAQYVRHGDLIWFPESGETRHDVDVVGACGDNGRVSGLFVHLRDDAACFQVSDFDSRFKDCGTLLKIDEESGNRIVKMDCTGAISFHGYGVAVVTNQITHSDPDGYIIR